MTSSKRDDGQSPEGQVITRRPAGGAKTPTSSGEVGPQSQEDSSSDEPPDWRFILAVVAHELRNPLNSIASALKILELDPKNQPNKGALALVRRQVALAMRLVGDLIDLSKAHSRGKLTLFSSSTTFAEILETSLATSQSLVTNAGHTLSVAPYAGAATFVADAIRLSQALTNLIDNAIKFTPRGGTILVSLTITDSQVFISVSDTGIGIAPDELPLLGAPFSQLGHTKARSPHGLGLGLFIVKSIAEAHGGSLEVQSLGKSKGSSFTVRFPRVRG